MLCLSPTSTIPLDAVAYRVSLVSDLLSKSPPHRAESESHLKSPLSPPSLSTLSLSSSLSPAKPFHKSTVSANPLQNTLTLNPLRPSNPSAPAAGHRAAVVWFRNDLRILLYIFFSIFTHTTTVIEQEKMACMHDHSCEEHDCSSDWSLYKHIDLSKVSALNEAVSGSVKSVFRAWEQRLNTSEGHLESNTGDPELIVFIPFTSDVKLKSISIVGGADGTSPAKMRAFINREGIDFSDAQNMQPVQEWDLVENLEGVLEFQTRYSRFQSVGNITLHFPDNFGGHTTQIHYIGLKGEATQLKRDVVATIVYEITPNPSDHKTHAETGGGLSHVE